MAEADMAPPSQDFIKKVYNSTFHAMSVESILAQSIVNGPLDFGSIRAFIYSKSLTELSIGVGLLQLTATSISSKP
ncbi:hypothetical protein COLO4_31001 [Corchorus olitorius]|uniref:Uncharacterized protein n=1 Tax=Corchorus olitorius TaxID=93759 RepID=A0A1R3H663_9ROSI|nr:hypothetical protein COLO4_31001 [Corchorus olitorius]